MPDLQVLGRSFTSPTLALDVIDGVVFLIREQGHATILDTQKPGAHSLETLHLHTKVVRMRMGTYSIQEDEDDAPGCSVDGARESAGG